MVSANSPMVETARRKLRIVLADDELEMREFLGRICRHCGHEVVAVAEHGEMLLQLCKATHPDLVITDLIMPHMDGLTALGQLRDAWTIPSIIITAHDRPELRAHAEQLGTVAYLVKPIGLSDLQPALTAIANSLPTVSDRPAAD